MKSILSRLTKASSQGLRKTDCSYYSGKGAPYLMTEAFEPHLEGFK